MSQTYQQQASQSAYVPSVFSIWCPVISISFEDADYNRMVQCPLAYTKEGAWCQLISQLCALKEFETVPEDQPELYEQLLVCRDEGDLDTILEKIGYNQTIWYKCIFNEHSVNPCDGVSIISRKRKLQDAQDRD